MPNVSRTAAIFIALVLAAILIVYVFAGGNSRNGGRQNDPALRARCSSTATAGAIKRELFRRAAELRGTDQAAFDQVSAFAVVRLQQAQLSGYDNATGAIDCRASAVIDLPPGIAVGGQHNLAGVVEYSLQRSADGTGEVVSINNAERILAKLAMIGQTGSAPQQTRSPTDSNPAGAAPVQTREPTAQTAAEPPASARQEPRSAKGPAARRRSNQGEPTLVAPLPRDRAAPSQANLSRAERPHRSVVAAQPRRSPGPSFDCRRASKAAHFAICRDPYLASLDRRMASDFDRAFSNGTPAVRELLQRTIPRFLGYRNACGTHECIANAYRSRITEINDIAVGHWRGP